MGVAVDDLKDELALIAAEVQPDYERATPRLSGDLVGSYRIGKAKSKAVIYVGRTSVPYAGVINYGSTKRGIEPADFIATGDETAAPKAAESLEQAISRLIANLNLG